MPKLSDIKIDPNRFKGKGIRPWTDPSVVKPTKDDIDINLDAEQSLTRTTANDAQTVSKPVANREQIVSNAVANYEQREQTVSEPRAVPIVNREQLMGTTVHCEVAMDGVSEEDISMLVGNERALVCYLFLKCRANGSLITNPITTNELKETLSIASSDHIRNLIRRVTKKQFINVTRGKKGGKSAWRIFVIPKKVYSFINSTPSFFTLTNSLPLAEPLASVVSSSNIYNKTTTSQMGGSQLIRLEEEWNNVDMEPLSTIGFNESHLSQIASQKKLTPQMVQDSIHHFAFDLENNKKRETIKIDPINYFMGTLLKGGPFNPPSNYESPRDRAMRCYSERMREIEQRRTKEEEEAMSLAFNEWFAQFTDDQKRQFLPKIMQKNTEGGKNSKILEESAKAHFKAEVWSNMKEKIVKNTNYTH